MNPGAVNLAREPVLGAVPDFQQGPQNDRGQRRDRRQRQQLDADIGERFARERPAGRSGCSNKTRATRN